MSIPYIDHGGTGEALHFLHANGYPPACYEQFIQALMSEYRVSGMLLRPLWPDASRDGLRDWNPFSDDLLAFLDERQAGPVIAVGHSIGAIVSLRAALKSPDHFRALVLLDPVLFPPYFIPAWNMMRMLGVIEHVHPLIASARKRRRAFDDLERVFRGYRRRDIFRYLDDDQLWDFIRGITKPASGGFYELAYTPEWEAHIYKTGVWRDMELWRALPRLEIPTIIIRGAETDTFWENTARLAKRRQPGLRVETLAKSTHLLPLERPREVFEIMQSFLKETL